ncbi:MAG: class I SAM-dependent methyltransferase [Asticcacaulis sp.]|nr:class I SAM-dependent methyltransferase [Asticcacaulis sp.]
MSQESAFTGSIPQIYEAGMGPVLFNDFGDAMAARAAALKPKRVLETAAGTGIVTRKLRDVLPADSELIATDLNPPMLEIARGKFAGGDAVEFRVADGTELPFDDGRFDLVVCQFGIMFYPDKPKSFREVYRVLEPGGHYLFSVWDSHHRNPYAAIVQALIEKTFPDDPPRFYHVPFSCHAIDPIKDMLLDAGFGEIRIDVLKIDKMVADLPAFAHAAIHGNPLIEQVRARDGVDAETLVRTLLDQLREAFGDRGPIPLQTITWSARKPA